MLAFFTLSFGKYHKNALQQQSIQANVFVSFRVFPPHLVSSFMRHGAIITAVEMDFFFKLRIKSIFVHQKYILQYLLFWQSMLLKTRFVIAEF